MRIAVINRFYPPDSAITGQDAQHLVQALMAQLPSAEFRIFTVALSYDGGVAGANRSTQPVAVERLSSPYGGQRKLPRLLASLYDGYRLAKRASAWADIVISMTDPPLLGYWAGPAMRQGGKLWIEWTMDLYPEAFVASGQVRADNILYRHFQRAMQKTEPNFYICLGAQQHRAVQRWRDNNVDAAIIPCGVCDKPEATKPEWLHGEDRTVLTYAGNLGEAHSCEVLIEIIRQADPARFLFVLAPFGSHRQQLLEAVRSKPHVMIRGGLGRSELAAVDVHIVSLIRAWTHICVPSKAVSAVCLGRPILFAGAEESDTWQMLGDAGWLIPEQPDGTYRTADIVESLSRIAMRNERAEKESAAARRGMRLKSVRDYGYTQVVERVREKCEPQLWYAVAGSDYQHK